MITPIEKFINFEDLLMINLNHFFYKKKFLRLLIQRFFILITRLGDGFFYPIIFLVVLFNSETKTKVVLVFVLGFLLERVIYYGIKNLTKRIRPFEKLKFKDILILPPDKYSFPSGHTSAAFFTATLVSLFIPAITLLCFSLAFLVGLSRIILNLHYPTDVFIGSVIGFAIAQLMFQIIY